MGCRSIGGTLTGALSKCGERLPLKSKARVVKWQTRRTQNPLPVTACGFESHPGHFPTDIITHGSGGGPENGSPPFVFISCLCVRRSRGSYTRRLNSCVGRCSRRKAAAVNGGTGLEIGCGARILPSSECFTPGGSGAMIRRIGRRMNRARARPRAAAVTRRRESAEAAP
jgi:hypothetical protein